MIDNVEKGIPEQILQNTGVAMRGRAVPDRDV